MVADRAPFPAVLMVAGGGDGRGSGVGGAAAGVEERRRAGLEMPGIVLAAVGERRNQRAIFRAAG